MNKCERCGVRRDFTWRYVVSISYQDADTPLDGSHVDDHLIFLCPCCLELTRAELMDSIRRTRESGYGQYP